MSRPTLMSGLGRWLMGATTTGVTAMGLSGREITAPGVADTGTISGMTTKTAAGFQLSLNTSQRSLMTKLTGWKNLHFYMYLYLASIIRKTLFQGQQL